MLPDSLKESRDFGGVSGDVVMGGMELGAALGIVTSGGTASGRLGSGDIEAGGTASGDLASRGWDIDLDDIRIDVPSPPPATAFWADINLEDVRVDIPFPTLPVTEDPIDLEDIRVDGLSASPSAEIQSAEIWDMDLEEISLFPYSAQATPQMEHIDLDEISLSRVCSTPPSPAAQVAFPANLTLAAEPSSVSPNLPEFNDLEAREAALQATWLGAFRNAMPSASHNPRPQSHFGWQDHIGLSTDTKAWTPSRLEIRDAQRAIVRAERDKQSIITLRESLVKSHLELESVFMDLSTGDL